MLVSLRNCDTSHTYLIQSQRVVSRRLLHARNRLPRMERQSILSLSEFCSTKMIWLDSQCWLCRSVQDQMQNCTLYVKSIPALKCRYYRGVQEPTHHFPRFWQDLHRLCGVIYSSQGNAVSVFSIRSRSWNLTRQITRHDRNNWGRIEEEWGASVRGRRESMGRCW